MLQSSVFSQLARITYYYRGIAYMSNFQSDGKKKSSHMSTTYTSPMTVCHKRVAATLKVLGADEKHWFAGGTRSSSVAVQFLKKNDIIAVPTDTIYGFASLAQSNEAIDRLYSIKGRERTKPLAITLSSVRDISQWAEIDHLPTRLLEELLPGPVTVVLKRKSKLNPALNPDHETVGIRVPLTKFIRHVCKIIGEPLALTSANISNQPSSLHPDEFSPLWPKLGAIFYDIPKSCMTKDSQRVGSTVVDLTIPGEFEILRRGVRYTRDLQILGEFGVRRNRVANSDESKQLRRDCSA